MNLLYAPTRDLPPLLNLDLPRLRLPPPHVLLVGAFFPFAVYDLGHRAPLHHRQ